MRIVLIFLMAFFLQPLFSQDTEEKESAGVEAEAIIVSLNEEKTGCSSLWDRYRSA